MHFIIVINYSLSPVYNITDLIPMVYILFSFVSGTNWVLPQLWDQLLWIYLRLDWMGTSMRPSEWRSFSARSGHPQMYDSPSGIAKRLLFTKRIIPDSNCFSHSIFPSDTQIGSGRKECKGHPSPDVNKFYGYRLFSPCSNVRTELESSPNRVYPWCSRFLLCISDSESFFAKASLFSMLVKHDSALTLSHAFGMLMRFALAALLFLVKHT